MSTKVFGPIRGAQRVLTVYDDHIVLEQIENFRAFLTNSYFNGDKEIFYCDMISCQYKEGSGLILGYLQFETPGSFNRNNFGSENSFTFENYYNEEVYKIYQYIRGRITEIKTTGRLQTPAMNSQESNLDELLKMKKLLDENIITQEEFDTFKKSVITTEKSKTSQTIPQVNTDGRRWECECGMYNSPSVTECEFCGRPRKNYN